MELHASVVARRPENRKARAFEAVLYACRLSLEHKMGSATLKPSMKALGISLPGSMICERTWLSRAH